MLGIFISVQKLGCNYFNSLFMNIDYVPHMVPEINELVSSFQEGTM